MDFGEGIRTVIYGDVAEGEIARGMRIKIPLNGALTTSAAIEAIEFLDRRSEQKGYLALVLNLTEEEGALLSPREIEGDRLKVF